MARVKQDLRTSLEAGGLVEAVGEDLIFPTLPAAVAGYAAWYEQRARRAAAGADDPTGPPDARRLTA